MLTVRGDWLPLVAAVVVAVEPYSLLPQYWPTRKGKKAAREDCALAYTHTHWEHTLTGMH